MPRASSDGARLRSDLPWDFIDTGVEKSFLLSELERAEKGEKTGSCYDSCAGCGMSCGPCAGMAPRAGENAAAFVPLQRPEAGTRSSAEAAAPNGANRADASFTTVTLRYAKAGQARYMGHLDTVDILLRAVRSAGISLKMHGKYHPKPRISLSAALPVGIESACEMMEVEAEGGWTGRRRPGRAASTRTCPEACGSSAPPSVPCRQRTAISAISSSGRKVSKER